jgi:hypothetical protein
MSERIASANGDRGGGCPYRRREQGSALTGDFFRKKRNPQSTSLTAPLLKGHGYRNFGSPFGGGAYNKEPTQEKTSPLLQNRKSGLVSY